MALDEQVRHSAEALASDLGRELQQRLGQFIETVLQEAAAERDALTAQAAQFAADAEAASTRRRRSPAEPPPSTRRR